MFFVDFCTWSPMGARAPRPLEKRAGAECCSLFFLLARQKVASLGQEFRLFCNAGYSMGRRGRVASAGQVASGRGRGSGRRRGDLSVFEFPNSDIVGNTSSEYETAVEEQVPREAETQAPASPINRMPHSQLMAERELLGMKILVQYACTPRISLCVQWLDDGHEQNRQRMPLP